MMVKNKIPGAKLAGDHKCELRSQWVAPTHVFDNLIRRGRPCGGPKCDKIVRICRCGAGNKFMIAKSTGRHKGRPLQSCFEIVRRGGPSQAQLGFCGRPKYRLLRLTLQQFICRYPQCVRHPEQRFQRYPFCRSRSFHLRHKIDTPAYFLRKGLLRIVR